MSVCAVLKYRGKPGWAVRQFFDLNRFIHDQAVRTQPAPGAHGEILDLPVAYMADVGLSVHRERSLFPGIDLELCHVYQGLIRGQIIGEWTGDVIGVTFPPKSIHHQIHVFQLRIVPEFRAEQFIQFGKRLLEFRRIVTRFTEIELGLVLLGFVANVDDGYFVL